MKHAVYARLRLTELGPGEIRLPCCLDGDHLCKLTAERVVTRFQCGRLIRSWQPEPFELDLIEDGDHTGTFCGTTPSRSCRPSSISSTIFAVKASRSPGFRLVTIPLETTTSRSIQLAPAFSTSVRMEW